MTQNPIKRKDADKGAYTYCEYLDAGMEGMKCSKGYGDKNCECLHCFGYECDYYKPEHSRVTVKNKEGDMSQYKSRLSLEQLSYNIQYHLSGILAENGFSIDDTVKDRLMGAVSKVLTKNEYKENE